MLRLFFCRHFFFHTKNVWTKYKEVYLAPNPVIYALGQSGKVLPNFLPQFSHLICSCEPNVWARGGQCLLLDAALSGLKPVVDYRPLGRGKVMVRSPWTPFNSQSFVCRIKNDYFSNSSRHHCYEPNTILFQSLSEPIVSLGYQSLPMVATVVLWPKAPSRGDSYKG